MNCLLDTHSFVWALAGNPRLSSVARAAIANRDNIIHVSSISFYELAFKYHLGKWPEAGPVVQNAQQLMSQMQFSILPVQLTHSLHAAALPLNHRDPFDRLLAAQAAVETMTLISSDKVLGQLGAKLLW